MTRRSTSPVLCIALALLVALVACMAPALSAHSDPVLGGHAPSIADQSLGHVAEAGGSTQRAHSAAATSAPRLAENPAARRLAALAPHAPVLAAGVRFLIPLRI